MDMSSLTTMDSLALPRELLWDGKAEPNSPPTDLFALTNTLDDTENWLYDDNIANGLTTLLADDEDSGENIDFKESIIISHELLNGDDIVIELCDLKQEYLLDTKLTPYLEYSTGIEFTQPHIATKVHSPVDIAAYGATHFDSAVLAQLTPPQSPPQNHSSSSSNSAAASPVYQHNLQYTENQANLNTLLSSIESSPSPSPSSPSPIPVAAVVETNTSYNNTNNAERTTKPEFHWNVNLQTAGETRGNTVNNTPNNDAASGGLSLNDDIALQMQLVDEIVSTRAKELSGWSGELYEHGESSSCSAPGSQAGSAMMSDDDDDEGTLPDSVYSSSVCSPINYQHIVGSSTSSSNSSICSGIDSGHQQSSIASLDSLSYDASATKPSVGKKRTRPYGRGVEDRKIRKKEQNKNAATRYRQKKKLELEEICSEEQQLQQRHEELQRILADTNREAKYLTSLIREFYQNRKKSK